MARHEEDREDLIREATALCPRVEWQVPNEAGVVFAGLKRSGALSLYFDQDPVYQFDPAGYLRRAYVGGFLYRSDGHSLARLHRERNDDETALVRHDLSSVELAEFQQRMRDRLAALEHQLRSGNVIELRRVAEGELPDFSAFIAIAIKHADKIAPAISPARSRR